MKSQLPRRAVVIAACAAPVLGLCRPASAIDEIWYIGAAATLNWSNLANWELLDCPDRTDERALFGSAAFSDAATVNVDADVKIESLRFQPRAGAESSFTINGPYALTFTDDVFNFGSQPQNVRCRVNFSDGSDRYIIGNNGGSTSYGKLTTGRVSFLGQDLHLQPGTKGLSLSAGLFGTGNVVVEGVGAVDFGLPAPELGNLNGENQWGGKLVLSSGTANIT